MSLRLVYFDGQARAEISRLIIAFGGVDCEDVRVKMADFPELKPKLPSGQLPVLEIDGVYVPQSKAIEGYLARLTGLYPADPLDALVCDVIREHYADAIDAAWKVVFAKPDQKEALTKEFKEVKGPQYLARFEKALVDNDGGVGWIIGDGVTYADIVVFHYCDYILNFIGADCLEGFGALAAHHDRVLSIPAIKAYVEERPKSVW